MSGLEQRMDGLARDVNARKDAANGHVVTLNVRAGMSSTSGCPV